MIEVVDLVVLMLLSSCEISQIEALQMFGLALSLLGLSILTALIKRKQVATLHRSEELFSKVFHSGLLSICVIRLRDSRILDANHPFLHLTGYSREEIIGRTTVELGMWANADERLNIMQTLHKGHSISEFKVQLGGKYGELRTAITAIETLELAGQTCMLAMFSDITHCTEAALATARVQEALQKTKQDLETRVEQRTAELQNLNEQLHVEIAVRKHVEAALAESEARFRALVQNSSDLITILEADGTIRFNSPALEQILGYRSAEQIGQNVFELIHPDDEPAVRSLLVQRLQQPGLTGSIQYRVRHADGCWIYIESVANNLLHDPSIKGIVVNSRDITDRKRAQEQIIFQASLLNQVRNAVIATDLEGNIIYWNQFAQSLYQWTDEEAIGKPILDVTAPLNDKELCQEMFDSINATGYWEGEFIVRRKDGMPFPIHLVETIVLDAEGNPKGYVSVSLDITERQQAEQARKASEQRYQLMAELSADLISRHTPQGDYLYASPACRTLLGYEPEELLGHSVYEFFHPEYASAFRQTHSAVSKLPEVYTLTHRHRRKDGSYIWLETTSRAVRHPEKPEVQEIIAVSRDITERKQAEAEICLLNEELEQRVIERTAELQRANEELKREISERQRVEEALRESEAKFRQIAENIEEVFWIVSPDAKQMLYISPAYENLWKRSCESLYQNPEIWINSIHPEDRERVSTAFGERYEGDTPFREEYRIILPDGSGRWIWAREFPIRNELGEVYRVVGIGADITERKQAEEELKQLRHRNELILNSAGEGILGFDRLLRVIFANPAAAKMLGYEVEELLDRPLQATLHPPQTDATFSDTQPQSPIAIALQEEVSQSIGTAQNCSINKDLFWRSDGSSFPVEYVCTPIQERGEIVGAVITFKDITERLGVERMKDEFISVVSHELRTPLTSMRGALGLLTSGMLTTQPEKAQRMLDIALTNTERLMRLINDILDLERIQSGKITMAKQNCNAADLMQQACEAMQAMADKAGVTLCLVPVDVQLLADPDRILQTLTNLLSNAIKFSARANTVWLTAEVREKEREAEPAILSSIGGLGSGNQRVRDSDSVRAERITPLMLSYEVLFTVKDQGRGIPADKLEIIFERFQQVDSSDSRQKGGTGLGLAICRSIVQQHGGHIWAESRLGEGSTFCFTLPVRGEVLSLES
ncbi:MAG: PAS domain S-box protein [Microcoleus vaginatus WJT46-NPBG5]|nr:PAS domain S-box protein [Microcoleus vaginatus WJT46-NPBG5]